MKKQLLLTLFIVSSLMTFSQETCTFEEFNLSSESYLNDAGAPGQFESGEIIMPNSYNDTFMSFTGWAISNSTDTETAGLLNEYSSITGGGEDSDNFGLANAYSGITLKFNTASTVESLSITNNTYAYQSMNNGDGFAKKFGGVTGNDPDFFTVSIVGYADGIASDEEEVSLADFTSSDNSQDYILDEWLNVDLAVFGEVDSLVFALSSSDVGDFGMNTPAYFCVDNIEYTPMIVNIVESDLESSLTVFPNPFVSALLIESAANATFFLYDSTGRQVQSVKLTEGVNTIETSEFLNAGIYTYLVSGEIFYSGMLIKE